MFIYTSFQCRQNADSYDIIQFYVAPTTHEMIRAEQNDSTSQIDYNSYWGSQEEI